MRRRLLCANVFRDATATVGPPLRREPGQTNDSRNTFAPTVDSPARSKGLTLDCETNGSTARVRKVSVVATDIHGRTLRLLLDTNVVIAHEDDDAAEPHSNAAAATLLIRTARDLGFELLVSSGTRRDVLQAPEALSAARRRSLDKYYTQLDSVPEDPRVRAQFPATLTNNNRADLEVLSTFAAGVATALVTEDGRMRNRAGRAGLRNVFTLEDAIDWLAALRQPTLDNAVAAQVVAAYQVNRRAPIFDSLARDYQNFASWWQDNVVDQRRHVIILGERDDPTGIAVLKEEAGAFGLGDRVLKVCTFKVDDGAGSTRRGELLLRALVDFAREQNHQVCYMTVWPHHEKLIGWLSRFGFVEHATTPDGERVMAKTFVPGPAERPLDPLAHQIRFGPRAILVERAYIVPIQARFHERLFPDSEDQASLLGNEACGNAIRKAYLCHAAIRRLEPGDTVAFLRTERKARARLTAVGVVEETLVSDEPDQVAAFVAGRTVYSYEEITALCAHAKVLAILFRLDRRVDPPWPGPMLAASGVMASSPQSITTVPQTGVEWLREQLSGH